jgi:hypothetical protein
LITTMQTRSLSPATSRSRGAAVTHAPADHETSVNLSGHGTSYARGFGHLRCQLHRTRVAQACREGAVPLQEGCDRGTRAPPKASQEGRSAWAPTEPCGADLTQEPHPSTPVELRRLTRALTQLSPNVPTPPYWDALSWHYAAVLDTHGQSSRPVPWGTVIAHDGWTPPHAATASGLSLYASSVRLSAYRAVSADGHVTPERERMQ